MWLFSTNASDWPWSKRLVDYLELPKSTLFCSLFFVLVLAKTARFKNTVRLLRMCSIQLKLMERKRTKCTLFRSAHVCTKVRSFAQKCARCALCFSGNNWWCYRSFPIPVVLFQIPHVFMNSARSKYLRSFNEKVSRKMERAEKNARWKLQVQ